MLEVLRGDATCAALYAGGCRGWALFAGGAGGDALCAALHAGGVGGAGGAGDDALRVTLYTRGCGVWTLFAGGAGGDALYAGSCEGGLCLLEVLRGVGGYAALYAGDVGGAVGDGGDAL